MQDYVREYLKAVRCKCIGHTYGGSLCPCLKPKFPPDKPLPKQWIIESVEPTPTYEIAVLDPWNELQDIPDYAKITREIVGR